MTDYDDTRVDADNDYNHDDDDDSNWLQFYFISN